MRVSQFLLMTAGVALLSACAGGGGSSSNNSSTTTTTSPTTTTGPTTTTNPTTTTSPTVSAGYTAQGGLAQMGVTYGWSFTGKGATVAVVDSQFDVTHPAISGSISTASENVYSGTYAGLAGVSTSLTDIHGTNMASIIVAPTSNTHMQGVAPDAQLLLIGVDNSGCGSSACVWNMWNGITYAAQQKASVINLSLGYVGGVAATNLSETDPLATAIRNAASTSLLVVAAGNSGFSSPDNPARFVAGGNATNTIYGIAVGAVDASNKIMSFSNRAGDVSAGFVVAPGYYWAATPGGGYVQYEGTSGAAAFVSGLAALLYAQNPQMTPAQVRQIIFSTATSLGDASIYGFGLVNATKALSPIGQNYVPAGSSSSDASGAPLENTVLAASPSVAQTLNAALKNIKGQEAMFFDSYQRGFTFKLTSASVQVSPDTRLLGWVQSAMAPVAGASIGRFSFSLAGNTPDITTADYSRPGQFRDLFMTFASNVGPFQGQGSVAKSAQSARLSYALSDTTTLSVAHADTSASTASLGWAIGRVSNDLFSNAALNGSSVEIGGALGLAGLRWSASYANSTGNGEGETPYGRADAARVGLRYAFGAQEVSVSWSNVMEQGRVLGLSGAGAYTMGGASTGLISVGYAVQMSSALRFEAGVNMSMSAPENGTGILRGNGDITSMGWHAMSTYEAAADVTWGLGVSQPSKIVAGALWLDVPVARTDSGDIVRSVQRVSLVPTATEIDYQATFNMRLSGQSDLTVATMLATNPEHLADAGPSLQIGVKFKARF